MSFTRVPLSVGDRIPGFSLLSQNGEPIDPGDFAGKPMLIYFYGKDNTRNSRILLAQFQKTLTQYQRFGVAIVGIGIDSVESHRQLAESSGLSFPLLCDPTLSTYKAYHLIEKAEIEGQSYWTATPAIFLTDTNFRIIKIDRQIDPLLYPYQLLAELHDLLDRGSPRHILHQAPVLLIPQVFEPDFCRHLIQIWHEQGNGESGFMREVDGQTVALMDYSHKIRRDHFLEPGETKEKIKELLGRRVTPEIWKAYRFNATRIEDFRIVCYDASRGGYFRPHRDNTTSGTAHRCFAMTLNLNVGEYEGGYLRFPEFGPHLYRPETGSAVIFSCSLLHEATDVTAGKRFALLTFFYGEQEAERRDRYREAREEKEKEMAISSR
ncbi:MAG: alkyl hydroperoxide reductase [Cyanobacteria bacterium J007]|nr:MAG: alkyl hydroperoxide reductase [Cyanobacteria bacterium J007]